MYSKGYNVLVIQSKTEPCLVIKYVFFLAYKLPKQNTNLK